MNVVVNVVLPLASSLLAGFLVSSDVFKEFHVPFTRIVIARRSRR
jgi:hypothetical protein